MSALAKSNSTQSAAANLALLAATMRPEMRPAEFAQVVDDFMAHFAGWPIGFADRMVCHTLDAHGFPTMTFPPPGDECITPGYPAAYDGVAMLACICEHAPSALQAMLTPADPVPVVALLPSPKPIQRLTATERRAEALRAVASTDALWLGLTGARTPDGLYISNLSLDTLVERISLNLPAFRGYSETTISRTVRRVLAPKHGLTGIPRHKRQPKKVNK